MRRVLFLAYYFPPVGGGGVQRAVKFCRYLVEFGWQPVVVTGPGGAGDLWAPEDKTLAAELPAEVEVHRIDQPEPSVPSWRGRIGRALDLMPATLRWWVDGATEVGRRAAREIDVILGELVPYATAHAAKRLSHELELPWVADLQDPWALDEMWLYSSGIHRARDTRRMHRLLGTASAIVMNTPEAALRVQDRFPDLAPRVAEAIPNGFDSADFEGVEPAAHETRAFRIVHSGYLHTEWGLRHRETRRLRALLGGTPVQGVDFLTRSHVYLLEAIDRLIAGDPRVAQELEVHLAGVLTETDREVAARSAVTRLHGYLPHDETIALVLSADLLFLPMHDLPTGVRAGLVPGKTYEYLGSGRPILGAVPEGDARELLEAAGNAFLCYPADVTRMAELIAQRLEAWRRGEEPPGPRADVIARYERRFQTGQLAAILDAARP
jgi:glycosyltransferase involved in cell wall biosynthesis